jgi:Paired amphipathic helix repeat
MSNKTQVERAPAAEFDHAIQYLNKIKTRYPDDQNNTYKQFLEILQTYRKEQQNSQKDPIGYQQREQRMMHDVRVLSFSDSKGAFPSLFCHGVGEGAYISRNRCISRCKRCSRTKKTS